MLSRLFSVLGLCLAVAFPLANAHAADGLTPTPIQQFLDNTGALCVGCKLFTYNAGTTTKINVFTDSGGATPFTDPILMNSRGEPANPTASSGIWLVPGTAYKFVLAPSTDTDPPTNAFWTVDQISSPAIGTAAAQNIGTSGANLCLLNANCIFSGADSFTNSITVPTVATSDNSTNAASTAFVQANIALLAPLLTKTPSTQTGNYTVLNADAHKTIYLNSSGVGGKTLTVSALGSYTDTNFDVGFCNKDTRRWAISSADSGSLNIYPGQCNILQSNGSALVYAVPFKKYVVTSATLINIGPTGSCNNGNDGMATGSAGAVCTPATARALLQGDYLCGQGGSLSYALADGTYSAFNLALNGPPPSGCGDQTPVIGDVANRTLVVLNCGSQCFDVEDHAITTVEGVTVNTPSATGFLARQFGVIDLSGVSTGASAAGVLITGNDGAGINVGFDAKDGTSAGLLINGGAATAFSLGGSGSHLSATTGTVSVTSNPITITNFISMGGPSMMTFGASQIIGGGAVTGTKWSINFNAALSTSQAITSCDVFFANVGSINGAATLGGQCQ